MSDDELLAGFTPDEAARALRALVHAPIRGGQLNRKPTWHELWEAGWIEPPWCPWPRPTEASLLQELREIGPGQLTEFFDDYCDALLQALYEREPRLLRRSVTKRYGLRWGIQ